MPMHMDLHVAYIDTDGTTDRFTPVRSQLQVLVGFIIVGSLLLRIAYDLRLRETKVGRI